MEHFYRMFARIILLLLIIPAISAAQQEPGGLFLTGKITTEQGNVNGAIIRMNRNGQPMKDYQVLPDGKYELRFEFNNDYVLIFQRNENFPQKIVISTHVPPEVLRRDRKFPPFPVDVNLFTEIKGVDRTFSENAIMKIYYSSSVDNFIPETYYNNPQIKRLIDQAIWQSQNVSREADLLKKLSAAELAELKKEYDGLLKKAGSEFDRGEYIASLGDYKAANRVFPNEQFPKDRIAEINDLIAILGLQAELDRQNAEKYKEIIGEADRLFALKAWPGAREQYSLALEVKVGDPYASERITEIDRLVAETEQARLAQERARLEAERLAQEQAARLAAEAEERRLAEENARREAERLATLEAERLAAEAEKARMAEEKARVEAERQARLEAEQVKVYNDAIASADQAFTQQDYTRAITGYRSALRIKPEESYPSTRIAEAETILAELAAARKAYDAAIATGDKAFRQNNFRQARRAYEDAQNALSAESYPAQMLEKIDEIEAREEQLTREKERLETERLAKLEAERLAAEAEKARQAEEKARLEAERQAQELAAREAAEAEKARLEAERLAKLEAERLAAEAEKARQAEEKARLEAERQAQELAAREAAEAEKARIAEEKARLEAERLAQELAAREAAEAEKARIAEEKARLEAERLAKLEAERLAAEAEKARIETERLAKLEAERLAAEAEKARQAEEKARLEAERQAQELAAREAAEAEKARIAEEKARLEAERQAQELAAREAAEAEKARIAEEKARLEAERLAKLEAERLAAEAEKARIETERLAKLEAERLAAEEKARLEAEEKARLEAERLAQELAAREAAEAEKARIAEEKARLEAERLAKLEAERLAAEAEKARLAAEKEAEAAARTKAVTNETDALYNGIITTADQTFEGKEYNVSRAWYYKALEIKAKEPYPTGRIAEINGILGSLQLSQRDREFQEYIDKGDEAFRAGQLAVARGWYNRSLTIKASDQYAKDQIADIQMKVAERMQGNAENSFLEYLQEGDKALSGKNYNVARVWYHRAKHLKPSDPRVAAKLENLEKAMAGE